MSASTFIKPAWRSLRRSPAFTLTATLTLVIGIGASVAMFALVNGVLLRPLPYGDPDRLVGIYHEMSVVALPKGNQTAAVNLRCLEGIDLAAIPVTHFDGRSM